MEMVQKSIKAERWQDALNTLKIVRSKAPTNQVAMFYEALCLFRLEQWDQAEKAARETIKKVGSTNESIREQLQTMIDQIPIARLNKDMDKVNKAMKAEQWQDALVNLKSVIASKPDYEVALFYQALCYFRMKQWDDAERCATNALGKAKTANIREQLESIVSQVPIARVNLEMEKVQKAIKAERWSEGLDILTKVLAKSPNNPVAWFYKSVCELRMGKRKEALSSARTGLNHANGSEYSSLRTQLNEVIQAADVPAWKGDLESAVKSMNAENWHSAKDLLDNVIDSAPANEQAYYYRAICRYRIVVSEIQSETRYGRLSSSEKDAFNNRLIETLKDTQNATKYNSDRQMKKSIDDLVAAIGNVFSQLNQS